MLAARCRKWCEFMFYDTCACMHSSEILEDYEIYFCPVCNCPFSKLSGLFQHVESPACERELDQGVIVTLQRDLEVYLDT